MGHGVAENPGEAGMTGKKLHDTRKHCTRAESKALSGYLAEPFRQIVIHGDTADPPILQAKKRPGRQRIALAMRRRQATILRQIFAMHLEFCRGAGAIRSRKAAKAGLPCSAPP